VLIAAIFTIINWCAIIIGEAAAKKQPLVGNGTSMANLRGGNSLDGLGIPLFHSFTHSRSQEHDDIIGIAHLLFIGKIGLPRAQGGPTPWIGGLPNQGMGAPMGGNMGMGAMGGRPATGGFPGMMGAPANNMGMGMGMNMGNNMGMMPMGGNMGMGMGGMAMGMGGGNMNMGMGGMGGMPMGGGYGNNTGASPFFPSTPAPTNTSSNNIFF
jgi:hypothetical protein